MPREDVLILHATINVPFEKAYEFAHLPENFSAWASGLATSLHRTADGWMAATPEGEAEVVFTSRNEHGVLDHRVRLPGRPEVLIPLRLIPFGRHTQVELVLFRLPGMSDADFERDAEHVRTDLSSLKRVLESR